MTSISVVIPVYNSAGTLSELIEQLEPALAGVADRYEVILVDDGSHDASWGVIGDFANRYAWVRGIELMRNYGQHNALLCGIRLANCEVVVTMDDDLQHRPADIPHLLVKLRQGYDVVYGTPKQEQHGLRRDLASQVTKWALQNVMGADTARTVSAFRAFRVEARDAFAHYQSPFVNIDVLLTWATTRFASVPVQHDQRRVGVSNYNFRKLVDHAFNMITSYSTAPLQIASFVGLFFTLFGIGVFAYVLAVYLLRGSPVAGFPFLASTIAIFSGAQLFALGIIGEYLARMHFRMMDRPTYLVHSQTSRKNNPE